MVQSHAIATTSVLFIDGYHSDRTYYVDQLKQWSPDYEVIEAVDGQSGLTLYRSRRIDCVILELDLPDMSGFQVLVDLNPVARRPNVAVLILTRLSSLPLWELARKGGAYACFPKQHTSQEELVRAIQHAIALVGLMPKENRYRPSSVSPST